MIDKDEEEEFDRIKWAAEYTASFISPEGVAKVWEQRQSSAPSDMSGTTTDNNDDLINQFGGTSISKHRSGTATANDFVKYAGNLFEN